MTSGTILSTIKFSSPVVHLAVDPAARQLLVTQEAGTVAVLDELSGVALHSIPIPGARDIAVDPARHLAFVTATNSSALTVVNLATDRIIHAVNLRTPGFAVAIDPKTHEVFVTDGRQTAITVVNELTRKVVQRIALNVFPYDLAVDAATGQLWVTAATADALIDISVSRGHTVGTRPTGSFPQGVAVDTASRTVYVAVSGGATVQSFAETSGAHARTTPVAGQPVALAVDPSTHVVVVAQALANAVTELGPRAGHHAESDATAGTGSSGSGFTGNGSTGNGSTGGGSTGSGSTVAVTPANAAKQAKPVVPSSGALLGAFVLTDPASRPTQASQVATLEKQVGRTLAVDNHFIGFQDKLIAGVELNDARVGRIPMLSWKCYYGGAEGIIDGSQDAVIRQAATEVAQYGHPVFVRYFWEMNLSINDSTHCLGGLGAAGYIRAWQHIWTIFQQQGATNASFVWVPSSENTGADADQYYPGSQYVDWVGADGYARHGGSPTFAENFGAFYQQWAPHKPLMIAETGAAGTGAEQASYLAGMFAALPKQFPRIRAVLYFDSTSGHFNYLLTAAGRDAFAAGGAKPYFTPRTPTAMPSITSSSPPTTVHKASYDDTVAASGFPVPELTVTGLPTGLRFTDYGNGTGLIHGNAQETGTFTLTERAKNQLGASTRTFRLLVRATT